MNGSILIFGGNKNQRESRIIEIVNREESKTFDSIKDLDGKPDIFIITLEKDEKSIGISQAREGKKFLQEKPFSYKKKFLIVFNSEKLTTQAQNSLLKTLEEPPSFALIILSAKTQNSLLDTIISRCKLIGVKENIKREVELENKNSLKKILGMELGQKLDFCAEISKEDKEEIFIILEEWIEEGRGNLLKNPKEITIIKNVKRIIEVKKDLENTNVNVRLSLEALVLSLY